MSYARLRSISRAEGCHSTDTDSYRLNKLRKYPELPSLLGREVVTLTAMLSSDNPEEANHGRDLASLVAAPLLSNLLGAYVEDRAASILLTWILSPPLYHNPSWFASWSKDEVRQAIFLLAKLDQPILFEVILEGFSLTPEGAMLFTSLQRRTDLPFNLVPAVLAIMARTPRSCSMYRCLNVTGRRMLRLSSCRLDYLPPEIMRFQSLEGLQLIGNSLTDLPREITALPKLSWLDVRHNQFSHWPRFLWHCPALTILESDHNPNPIRFRSNGHGAHQS